MSKDIPILKKPSLDPSDISNYQPLSLLPFLCKILKSIVYIQLFLYLTLNNLQDLNQSDLKLAHSTETTVVAIFEKLHAIRSAKLLLVLILLNLTAVFDIVKHNLSS